MEESFNTPVMQDTSDQGNEDDDALSLSDLPIYGIGGEETPKKEDNLGVKEYTSSLSFEFFSEEWSSTILSKDSSDHTDTPTVVFSGKIIPHDEILGTEDALVMDSKKGRRKFGYQRLSLWTFNSLARSSSFKSSDSAMSGRYVRKDEVSVKRVPIVRAPRSKWYLYIFGLVRFPPKMHVRDLRRRHGSMTSKRPITGSVGGGGDGNESSSYIGCGKGLGWWTLIRVLGCGGGGAGDDHANTVVTATYGLAPRLNV